MTRRELDILRKEVNLERTFSAMATEIVKARADIPRYSDLEHRVNARQFDLATEVAALRQELTATKEKLSKLRVKQSETDFGLGQLEKKARESGVELKFQTSESTFSMRDMHPDAAAAWQRFVAGVLESPQDDTATMFLPPGTA